MKRIILTLLIPAVLILLTSCGTDAAVDNEVPEERIQIEGISKWYNGYQSVYTPTYDSGRPDLHETENNWLIERDLFMDYEIVSYNFDKYPSMYTYLKENLVPYGFGVFGHGHKHDNHDNYGYEYSLNSFTQNYNSMVEHGFQPISYAYPYGAGLLPETRQALKESGFLSGRLFQPEFGSYGPYITPGDEMEPPDWFALPSLRMEDIGFENRSDAVNNPEEFITHLDKNIELGSWLISTYHGIGWDGETDGRPVGWGFYKRENFYEEMLYVKSHREEGNVWLATMDDVTLYMMQRNNATYDLEKKDKNKYELYLDDGLDNELYRMNLTLKLTADPDFIGKTIVLTAGNETIKEMEIESEEILINLHPSGITYTLDVI